MSLATLSFGSFRLNLPLILPSSPLSLSPIPASAQELIQKTRWGLGGELSETEEARLAEYFNSGKYKPKQEFMHWAFVAVDKANRIL
ncbi:hypothetical protein [Campylobacter concisus]|uniref:hypothetical protein n=1 Tax=Campylobacter concisus TaxID=199 RepID=UPI00214DE603|nr:hypothetical protein [Campylobacter concisus]